LTKQLTRKWISAGKNRKTTSNLYLKIHRCSILGV
jgi:hypothetical protein